MSGIGLPLAPTPTNPVPLVVDRLEPFSAAEAAAIVAACPSVAAFAQYLETLTPAAVAGIHATGRGILLLIEGHTSGLSSDLGTSVGQARATKAMSLGAPQGVSIVIDQEDQGADVAGALAYPNACAVVLGRYGFRPGAYYGAPQTLSAAQLFSELLWPYWRGGSVGLGHYEPACGDALIQLPPLERKIAGCVVDVSAACVDGRGRTFAIWAPTPINDRETQPELPDSPGP
jgi:hypothetical protein